MRVVTEHGAATIESPAFPRLSRWLAVALIGLLALAALRAAPALLNASWTSSSLLLMLGAALTIAWLGYWIVFSRTRLEGQTLVQTWIWTKRTRVDEVAQLKLVFVPGLVWLVAPRLLVRQRSGAVLWFQAADVGLLRAFGERVAEQQHPKQHPQQHTPRPPAAD